MFFVTKGLYFSDFHI